MVQTANEFVQSANDFNAIRISLASPDLIKQWSFGEVTKAETINYRTLRPEKDGLFCERIFGPTKDWECYCGKYKKIRYKGVICDRCGVEVARAKVRRERMGHIALAAPVAHIWFSKGIPSRIGLLLEMSPRDLERVLYFAQYIVTEVNDHSRNSRIEELKSNLEEGLANLENIGVGEPSGDSEQTDVTPKLESTESEDSTATPEESTLDIEESKTELEENIQSIIEELSDLKVGQLLTESQFREKRDRFGEVFTANIGAEAILDMLSAIDLDATRNKLQEDVRSTSGQRRRKAIKTLRVVEAFRKSGNLPEWMTLTILPVLPPELRPMVQLDGGRFATSDLNDLYRRVINRNNRLTRLIQLQAPEIIIRNEKRMLQEAVDALIDNGRRGRAVAGSHNHKLKSLSDLLRGKHGRFRQNLLGKRVDYSGRSVITVGPTLKLHECGLPRRMALELFKPFVMNRLVMKGYAHNIKSAKRLADRARPEVWDILEDVVKERPVLLNRAPTLHRLGIQAFKPILVDGGAIQLHPLVCTAFGADFDGDQMAVHVPLSKGAVQEANKVMLSSYNMLSPSSGEPIMAPSLDIVLGCYYLTMMKDTGLGAGRSFDNFDEAHLAFELGQIELRTPINIIRPINGNGSEPIETSVGRITFNDALPNELGFRNQEVDKTALKDITSECFQLLGEERTLILLDAIKELGFRYASQAGVTIAINDIEVSEEKQIIISDAEGQAGRLEQQYMAGLITEDERYSNAVQIWTDANDKLTGVIEDNLRNYGGIYLMATSGAKGNIAQIKQMAGMRGLMSDPKGRIIDYPIKSNFREGLSVLEYFISTHGARKGLADTALRTADSGYLTRRLIDVAQEVTISPESCGTQQGIWIPNQEDLPLITTFEERLKSRYPVDAVVDPKTGEVIIGPEEVIDDISAGTIRTSGVDGVLVRSPLTCETPVGVCAFCYGVSLATWKPVMEGEAVGIIAAQSIGEPGTQLTMRTFHTGGIAGLDITSGLPRVEELFEARNPRGEAVLSEIDGTVEIFDTSEGRRITVSSTEDFSDEYHLPDGYVSTVSDGDEVTDGTQLGVPPETSVEDNSSLQPSEIMSRVSGTVRVIDDLVTVNWTDQETREYVIPAASRIVTNSGEHVSAGQALTAGPKNPQQILRIQGRESVQKYLNEEVQRVYRSQGVLIHDKHIEVIIRQMLRKVKVDAAGDTDLLPGELIERQKYEEINSAILAEGGEPATASPNLLGITKASLSMESFLAAASFQETTRVLTESALKGDVDHLRGLKENVIIGRLIPARYDLSQEGKDRLGLDELQPSSVGIAAELGENMDSFDIGDSVKDIL